MAKAYDFKSTIELVPRTGGDVRRDEIIGTLVAALESNGVCPPLRQVRPPICAECEAAGHKAWRVGDCWWALIGRRLVGALKHGQPLDDLNPQADPGVATAAETTDAPGTLTMEEGAPCGMREAFERGDEDV